MTVRRSKPRLDCVYCQGFGFVKVSNDPDETADCICTDPVDVIVVEQIAMFTQAHDAIRNGSVVGGVAHPTWVELGPDAREEYIQDAARTVRAMVALGWGPRHG